MRVILKLMLGFLLLTVGPWAQSAGEFREGKEYTLIESAAPVDKTSKIAVIEFFSYQCPHCNAFAKPLHEWSGKLPADVQFDRKPVSIGHQAWADIARTYYALHEMGSLESLDAAIFNAIHQQGLRLDSIAYIMGWLNQQKVPLDQFDTVYRSAKVRDALAAGEQLAAKYQVSSIPTIVVDGKYKILIASNVAFDQQLATVDKLIALARAERAK